MDYMIKTIDCSIDKYKADRLFDNKKIVVFGVNNFLGHIINQLYPIPIVEIFDNDINKQGDLFWDIPVTAPKRNDEEEQNDVLILIASQHSKSMGAQLQDLGYQNFCIIDLLNISAMNWLEKDLEMSSALFYIGENVFKRLAEMSGNNKMLVFPSKSIGDAFLPLKYMPKDFYIKQMAIVTSGGAKKVLEAYGFKNVIVINEKEMLALQKFYALNVDKLKEVIYVHPRYFDGRHIGIGLEMMAAKGCAFWEAYGPIVFDTGKYPAICKECYFPYNHKQIESLFFENGLRKGHTVILAPYTNSMGELPLYFWGEIANELKRKGMCVCTNISSDREVVIRGTIPLRCEIRELQEVARLAGYVIMCRSGISDILSDVDVKKIVLYKNYNLIFGLSSFFDNNDLRKGGIDGDAVQLIVDERYIKETFRQVISQMEEWRK